jgi:hypothetical protein
MMRRIQAAFAALSFIASANALASYAPFQGSTVFVPPLLTKASPAELPPSTRVLRLPPQAGLVRTIVTTNMLAKGPSWIAFGDKYISLCAPNRLKVACSPVTATATMRDINIRAYVGDHNAAVIAYDFHPSTTRTAAELIVVTDYFNKQLAKKVAHFNRMAAVYAPPPPRAGPPKMTPGTDPKKAGINPMLIAEVGGSCVYDDFGDLDCSGGEGGAAGAGTDVTEYDWTNEADWDTTEDTSLPPIPSFPIGPDTNNLDPCTGPDGSNICQQITVTGTRPSTGGCVYGPFGRACTFSPPVIGDPLDVPPPAEAPWFSQDACNMVKAFCTKNQVQDNERIPVGGDGVSYEDKVIACEAMYDFEMTECSAYRGASDARSRAACRSKAADRLAACMTTARNTSGGKA